MITFEEVGAMLDDIVDELPEDLFKGLNGGINLVPDTKLHPESDSVNNLYIMGEYNYQPFGLGRFIIIYYGSFMCRFAYCSPAQQREELRKILHHEFLHHLESLAGDRSLERKDAQDLAEYRQRRLNK